jgi:hypothetical protein
MCKEKSARKVCFKRRIQQREQGVKRMEKSFGRIQFFWKVCLLQKPNLEGVLEGDFLLYGLFYRHW